MKKQKQGKLCWEIWENSKNRGVLVGKFEKREETKINSGKKIKGKRVGKMKNFCFSVPYVSDSSLSSTSKNGSEAEKLWEGWVGRLVQQFFLWLGFFISFHNPERQCWEIWERIINQGKIQWEIQGK